MEERKLNQMKLYIRFLCNSPLCVNYTCYLTYTVVQYSENV